jgi:hypothetical protein
MFSSNTPKLNIDAEPYIPKKCDLIPRLEQTTAYLDENSMELIDRVVNGREDSLTCKLCLRKVTEKFGLLSN